MRTRARTKDEGFASPFLSLTPTFNTVKRRRKVSHAVSPIRLNNDCRSFMISTFPSQIRQLTKSHLFDFYTYVNKVHQECAVKLGDNYGQKKEIPLLLDLLTFREEPKEIVEPATPLGLRETAIKEIQQVDTVIKQRVHERRNLQSGEDEKMKALQDLKHRYQQMREGPPTEKKPQPPPLFPSTQLKVTTQVIDAAKEAKTGKEKLQLALNNLKTKSKRDDDTFTEKSLEKSREESVEKSAEKVKEPEPAPPKQQAMPSVPKPVIISEVKPAIVEVKAQPPKPVKVSPVVEITKKTVSPCFEEINLGSPIVPPVRPSYSLLSDSGDEDSILKSKLEPPRTSIKPLPSTIKRTAPPSFKVGDSVKKPGSPLKLFRSSPLKAADTRPAPESVKKPQPVRTVGLMSTTVSSLHKTMVKKPAPQTPMQEKSLPRIDSDSENEDIPNTKIRKAHWAVTPVLKKSLQLQTSLNPDILFGTNQLLTKPLNLEQVFESGSTPTTVKRKRKDLKQRGSSAHWSNGDQLTATEIERYNQKMGF